MFSINAYLLILHQKTSFFIIFKNRSWYFSYTNLLQQHTDKLQFLTTFSRCYILTFRSQQSGDLLSTQNLTYLIPFLMQLGEIFLPINYQRIIYMDGQYDQKFSILLVIHNKQICLIRRDSTLFYLFFFFFFFLICVITLAQYLCSHTYILLFPNVCNSYLVPLL